MLNAWHLPVAPYLRRHGEALEVTLWLAGATLPQHVLLRCEPDNEEWLLAMSPRQHPPYVVYRARLTLAEGEALRRYCFKLLWADRQCWLTPTGLQSIPPGQTEQFAVSDPSPYPQWVADRLFYQIFPDRFARASGQRDEAAQGVRAWDAPLDESTDGYTRYGGDLDGIIEWLPYLQALGVDACLGGDAALIRLRQATHDAGMHLILDGVFNHTGDSHPWFDRHRQGERGGVPSPRLSTA